MVVKAFKNCEITSHKKEYIFIPINRDFRKTEVFMKWIYEYPSNATFYVIEVENDGILCWCDDENILLLAKLKWG